MSKTTKRLQKAVPVDLERIAASAIEAAMSDSSRSRKHHPVRAIATGAALATAAGVGYKRLPRVVRWPIKRGVHKLGDAANLDGFTDAVRDRFADLRHGEPDEPEDYNDGGYDDDDEPQDEYDEPESEGEEDFDDEEEDEDELEDEDDVDEEPERESEGDCDDEDVDD